MTTSARISLPAVFTDHLVLQRRKPVVVWGTAQAGETVRVEIAGASATARADATGAWRVSLPAMEAGGPHVLVASGERSATATVRDVLVGEVWLCSGQSNMEWPSSISGFSEADLAGATHAGIRLLKVPVTGSDVPRADVLAAWAACTPDAVLGFSGVGYAFGLHLHQVLGVPVGLIHCALGGSDAAQWTRLEVLRAHPWLLPIAQRYDAAGPHLPPDSPEIRARYVEWEKTARHQDPGNAGEPKGWATPDHADADWETMRLPTTWEATGLDIDGAVWFRLAVEVPPAWKSKDLTLSLGPIDDFDTTYVNGERVGAIGKEVPNAHQVPRVYTVPARLVRAGRNVIAVRVFDHFGSGGICGTAAQMLLHPVGSPEQAIRLSGNWRYRIELRLEPLRNPPPEPASTESPWQTERLYNAMIHPIAGFALRGAIWYQGETNAGRAEQYRVLLGAMVADWRRAWKDDFAFLQVQLAPWMARKADPVESEWAELREAQAMLAREMPGVGMASIIDNGDGPDIHPRNKALVGHRLALQALGRVYEQTIPHHGPRMRSWAVEGPAIRIRFDVGAFGGVLTHGTEPLSGFAIAGEDRRFVWAEARIDVDSVLVSSPAVAKPAAVRYAWADNPACSLMNPVGLPAEPFRTDVWPGLTAGKR